MSVSLAGGVRFPKIYAYTTPEYEEKPWEGTRAGQGVIKIGETQRDVDVRIREQLNGVRMPVSTPYTLLLAESAITDDGRVFTDKDVHRVLERAGAHNAGGEWYECTPEEVAGRSSRCALASTCPASGPR